VRPTFGDGGVTVETHVLDFEGDLYGSQVELSFVQRLRDERKFADVDALREQLEADRRQAVRLFGRMSV
jgi:FAD synthase